MGDDTVTVELEIDSEMLRAMRRVRRNQRRDQGTRTAELADESPGQVVSQLLRLAYSSELRRAHVRGASGGPPGADARYTSK